MMLPEGKGGDKPPMLGGEPKPSGGVEREYAREAFSALQDGDEEGFITAFISAVKACASKSSAGGYEDEETPLTTE